MKFNLELFQSLNEEYRDKPLVKSAPSKAPHDLEQLGANKAEKITKNYGFHGKGLEIGCGRGEVCRALANNHNCNMTGIDVKSYQEWTIPTKNVVYHAADLSAGDLPHLGNFDFIYSNSVLEHVVHPYSMLKRAFELLKPGGLMFLSANLYRGPRASHRYREVFFPWPHLLFSDEVFEEYYVSIGLKPARAAWVNQLSINDYRNYFRLIGFVVKIESFIKTPIDEVFYKRFHNKLSRIPRYDLERDFIQVLLTKPRAAPAAP